MFTLRSGLANRVMRMAALVALSLPPVSNALGTPAMLAGPVEVLAASGDREAPLILALVADDRRFQAGDDCPDLFQIVALPLDRDLESATTLAALPERAFHLVYPPRPLTRAAAIGIDPERRFLCVVLSKAVGDGSQVSFYAYSIAFEDDGSARLVPIEERPRMEGSPTVDIPLFLQNEDMERGPIRFIDMEAEGEIVRVVMRISEDDDSPVIYEVRTSDWSATRVSSLPVP